MTELGATGEFPRGKIRNDDEGELRIAITTRDKTVFVAFGKEVAWLGLDADTARAIGTALIENANKLEN